MDDRNIVTVRLALFIGARLCVVRRDEAPGLAWPGYLDLPGGACAPGEAAQACVLRVARERLGLALTGDQLTWRRFYPDDPAPLWVFAAHLPETAEGVAVGTLMAPQDFVAHPRAVPHVRLVLRDYLQTER